MLAGEAEHLPRSQQNVQRAMQEEQPFQLLVDIQKKLAQGKGAGYERWAKT